ncbi:hypothetical protein [Streptacidiphilus sp. EB129]|uniref:hypothetical protein n=1 Tax=Streptacidiphilus sp. EB129 TaxID=3156262 RepID=UPI003514B880
MRRRSVVLLVSGVLAVGGIVLPSIQEQGSHGDTRITRVVVNGGKPIVLGPDSTVPFTFSITAEDGSGVRSVDNVGFWGPNDGILKASATSCTATSKTVSVCTGTSSVSTGKSSERAFDDMAGVWHVHAVANGNDGDKAVEDGAGTFSVLKAGVLSVFGVQQVAAKGTHFTVGGLLQKPQWQTKQWVPNPDQKVELQFCATGCRKPTVVAKVWSDAQGEIIATVAASSTGTYNWYYPGQYWAQPVASQAVQTTVSSG